MLKKINSVFWLGAGVILLVIMTTGFLVVFIIPTLYALISPSKKDDNYVHHVWVGFDKMWNAILNGDHRETFSSRLGKIWWHNAPTRIPKCICYRLLRLLDVIDNNHCRKSIDWNHGWKVNG